MWWAYNPEDDLDDLPGELADSLRAAPHPDPVSAESEDEWESERTALDRYMSRFQDAPSSSTLGGDASDALEASRGDYGSRSLESAAAGSEAAQGEDWQLSLFESPRLPSTGRDGENEEPGSERDSVTEGRLPALIPIVLSSPPASRWAGSEAMPPPIARRVPFAATLERAAEAHRAPAFFHPSRAKRVRTPTPDGGRKVRRRTDPGLVEDDSENENVRLFLAWYRGLAGYTMPCEAWDLTGFERYRRSTTSLAASIRTEELESVADEHGSFAGELNRSSPQPWPSNAGLTPPPPRPDLAQAGASSRICGAAAKLSTWAQNELQTREERFDGARRKWRPRELPWSAEAEAWFALGRAEGRRDQARECADRAQPMREELGEL